jgi:hypothetical protein
MPRAGAPPCPLDQTPGPRPNLRARANRRCWRDTHLERYPWR